MSLYLRPTRTEEALERLAATPLTVLAGGTDHYPARVARPLTEDILDISALEALRGIRQTDEGWRIGATTTWTQLIEAELPPLFDGAASRRRAKSAACRSRTRGTIAGNLCNASPAARRRADPAGAGCRRWSWRAPTARDACRSTNSSSAPRRTARRADELLTAIQVPQPRAQARGRFLKLGARRYLVISIAMVAARDRAARATTSARRASRSAPARRWRSACRRSSRRSSAQPLDARLGERLRAAHLAPLAPIDDVARAAPAIAAKRR